MNELVNQQSLNELALFAGAGGGILGGKLLGWRTVCAVEWEPYPASVLCARQNDGLLPPFPIWDDVQTFDGKPWRGIVDVVSGGFPCQDISVAGKGAGIDGERSGMWRHMARIVGEVRPSFVYVENSPAIITRGLGRILGDLAALGYDCRWTVLGAADIGAPHQRDRFWLVANAYSWDAQCGQSKRPRICAEETFQGSNDNLGRSSERQKNVAYSSCNDEQRTQPNIFDAQGWQGSQWGSFRSRGDGYQWWATEPNVGRVAHGLAARVDRLKAIGNGQVPSVAATAWELLTENV